MTLSQAQATEVLDLMEAQGDTNPVPAINQWITDNSLNGQINVQEIRRQLMETHRTDALRIRGRTMVEKIVKKICDDPALTVQRCDDLLTGLQACKDHVQTKKDALLVE